MYSIARAETTHDPPREVSGDLDQPKDAALGVLHRDQIALVVLARFVTKRGAEFSCGMHDHGDFAANRCSIDVDV